MLDGLFCELQASSVTWTMDILYGGLGIGKLQFLIKKKFNFFFQLSFFKFLVIKALDPDLDWSPASDAGSGSGKNEYGSETLRKTAKDVKYCTTKN